MNDRQLTFDRIKQSGAYADRASRAIPSAAGSYVGAGCGIVVLSVVCLGALTFTIGLIGAGIYASRNGEDAAALPVLACVAVVPAIMTITSFAILITIIRRIARYSKASTHAVPAMVVSKHSRGSGQHVANYILLEFEDGQRQEYRIGHEREVSLVGVGDAGIAYTKLDVILAFDRVP